MALEKTRERFDTTRFYKTVPGLTELVCSNKIYFENDAGKTLNLKAFMDDESVLEKATFSPGETAEVTVKKGSFKATATGSNYNHSVENTFNGCGTFLVEFDPDGVNMWKRISSGY